MSHWLRGVQDCERYFKANQHKNLDELVKEAYELGYEIMVHLPNPMDVDLDKFEFGEGWVDYVTHVKHLIKTSRTDILQAYN